MLSWLRRKVATALADLVPNPAPVAPAPAPPAAPAPAPALPLGARDDAAFLASLPATLHCMYGRVRAYERERSDTTRTPCTASNYSLGRNWYGEGQHLPERSVRRYLARLAKLGLLEGWEEARHVTPDNPTGRALRTLAGPLPAHLGRQLELRLQDRRPRKLAPHELEQGYADPPAPFTERRRPPERPSGGPPCPAGPDRPDRPDRSADPDPGSSGTVQASPDPAGRTAPGGYPHLDPGAPTDPPASAPAPQRATGAASPSPPEQAIPGDELAQKRAWREECVRRRKEGLLGLFAELHAGAATCPACKELGAVEEKDRRKQVVGLLFPSTVALEAAKRGHLPLENATDECTDEEAGGAAPEAIDPERARRTDDGGVQLRVREVCGKPAFHDGTTWQFLTEAEVQEGVRDGLLYDDRPPPQARGGPPSDAPAEPPPDIEALRRLLEASG